jgi:hypothetical protein
VYYFIRKKNHIINQQLTTDREFVHMGITDLVFKKENKNDILKF